MINRSMFPQELEPHVESPKILENEVGEQLMAPQKIATVKMEMVADDDEKMRMYERARMAVEACDRELLEKTRKYEELMLEKHKKKMQVQQLEKIVRLKLAEADMFQLKVNEAKQEVLRLQKIALVSEEEYANSHLKQQLREAAAEKQYLIEKIKLEEHSQASNNCGGGGGPAQTLIHSKMDDLLYSDTPKTEFNW
ncbi:putative oberon, coiled-coil region [Rosa chinensis]|uniref:Putative oberon, coiled-coil region n=2 Tax=Rosa chinensis TaxID=74649 RepID=A0A2P6PBK9_ROSCH|nr:putative oberon, coiled-coil region [Rosa chinensis]